MSSNSSLAQDLQYDRLVAAPQKAKNENEVAGCYLVEADGLFDYAAKAFLPRQ